MHALAGLPQQPAAYPSSQAGLQQAGNEMETVPQGMAGCSRRVRPGLRGPT